jgi:dipeptidyl-peptidase-4
MPDRPAFPVSRRRLGVALAATALLLGTRLEATSSPPKDGPSETLTIERIFAGPALTGPGADVGAWCPDGDVGWLAWRDAEGRRLELVDAESGKGRVLLREADLEGERPATPGGREVPMRGIGRAGPRNLLFSRDGKSLFLAWRGDVHHVHLATGARTRLTRTLSPISDVNVAPDGRAISFVRDHDLWAVLLRPDGPKEIRLTEGGSETLRNGDLDWVYPEELDISTGSWWSPDATRVAFLRLDETRVPRHAVADPSTPGEARVSQFYPRPGDRNPTPSVGVLGLDGAAPTWLDLGDDEDVYVPWVAWHPSGPPWRVIVGVLDRAQQRFEARVLSPDGAPPEVLWAEEHPKWVDVPPAPRVLPDGGGFLWRSRKDGFWRVWRQPLGGGEARALTPADREAGAVLAVDAKAGTFLYEGATDDLRRTTLMRGRLDGTGSPETLLGGEWNHAVSASPNGRWLVDTTSLSTVPPTTTLRRADGTEVRVLARQTTPAHEALRLVSPEWLTVRAADGVALSAVLWKPPGFDPARTHPLIVHVYGGPGSSIVRDTWRGAGSYYTELLARDGFLVLAVDGRGTGGRGKDFETVVHRRLGLPELDDQVAAVREIAKRPGVDGERVGIWGWSYGGTMACLAMARAPTVFHAGVAVAPVTDWRLYDSIYTERYLDRPEENPDGYRDTAAVSFAKDVRGALLLMHGIADDNVHVANTLRLGTALLTAKRPFDQMLYPACGHGIGGAANHVDVYGRIREHFRRHLGGPR